MKSFLSITLSCNSNQDVILRASKSGECITSSYPSISLKWILRLLRPIPSLLLVISIFLLALYLRLLVVDGSQVYLPLRSDAGQYYSYAYNLRYHHIYSITETWRTGATPIADDLRNPGYPVFLASLLYSRTSSANLDSITLAQALISTVTVMLVYFTLRHFSSIYIAALGALLTTLSPHLINMNVYLMTESIATFTMVLFLWLFARVTTFNRISNSAIYANEAIISRNNLQYHHLPWLLLGVIHAIGTLIRPTMQWYIFPLLGIIYALPKQKWCHPWQRVFLLFLGFFIVMLPWWIRNTYYFGELNNSMLLINTLHHGMYPSFIYNNIPESFGYPYRFDPHSSTIAGSLNSVLSEIIHRFMVAPGQHLYWYLIGKPIMFWSWSNDAAGAGDVFIFPMLRTPFATNSILRWIHDIMRFLHIPLVLAGMLSSIIVWLPPKKQHVQRIELVWFRRIISSILLYFVVLHMIGAPFPRYNIPILPVMYMQAILGLSSVYYHCCLIFLPRARVMKMLVDGRFNEGSLLSHKYSSKYQ